VQAGDDECLRAATVGQGQRRRRALEVEISEEGEGRDVIGTDRDTRDVDP
jgi:hypothetical protein